MQSRWLTGAPSCMQLEKVTLLSLRRLDLFSSFRVTQPAEVLIAVTKAPVKLIRMMQCYTIPRICLNLPTYITREAALILLATLGVRCPSISHCSPTVGF